MKIYIPYCCLLLSSFLHAASLTDEVSALQRNLVNTHNRAYGKDSIIAEASAEDIANFDNVVTKQIFLFVNNNGSQTQKNMLGTCLAAHIDLNTLYNKAKAGTVSQVDLKTANDIRLKLETIINDIEKLPKKTTTTRESQEAACYKILNHVALTLSTTLKKLIKECVEKFGLSNPL